LKDLGWTVKHEEFDLLGNASFCGCLFNPDDMIIITNPLKVLASFGWTPRRYIKANIKTQQELMRAKALSYLYQYTHCPIVDPFCRRIIEMTGGIKIRASIIDSFEPHKKGLILKAEEDLLTDRLAYKTIPIRTRLLMEEKFGITPIEQTIMEVQLRCCTGPFNLDIIKHKIPRSWSRTADVYIRPYDDDDFCCDLPMMRADETLHRLGQLKGVTPKTFEKYKKNKNNIVFGGSIAPPEIGKLVTCEKLGFSM